MSIKIIFDPVFGLNGARRVRRSDFKYQGLYDYVINFTSHSVLKTSQIKMMYSDPEDKDKLVIDSEETWIAACSSGNQTTLIVTVEPITPVQSVQDTDNNETIPSKEPISVISPIQVKIQEVIVEDKVEAIIPLNSQVMALWRRYIERPLGTRWYKGVIKAYDQEQKLYSIHYPEDDTISVIPRHGIEYNNKYSQLVVMPSESKKTVVPKFALHSNVHVLDRYGQIQECQVIAFDAEQNAYTLTFKSDCYNAIVKESMIRYSPTSAKYQIGQSITSNSTGGVAYIQGFDTETGTYIVSSWKPEIIDRIPESSITPTITNPIACKFPLESRVIQFGSWMTVKQYNQFTKQYYVKSSSYSGIESYWINEHEIVGTSAPMLLQDDKKTITPEFEATLTEIYRRYAKTPWNKKDPLSLKVMFIEDFKNFVFSCQITTRRELSYHLSKFYQNCTDTNGTDSVLLLSGFLHYYKEAAIDPKQMSRIWKELFAQGYNCQLKLKERKFFKGEIVNVRYNDDIKIWEHQVIPHDETPDGIFKFESTGTPGTVKMVNKSRIWINLNHCDHCKVSPDDSLSNCICSDTRTIVVAL
jgi:hypothetical protein